MIARIINGQVFLREKKNLFPIRVFLWPESINGSSTNPCVKTGLRVFFWPTCIKQVLSQTLVCAAQPPPLCPIYCGDWAQFHQKNIQCILLINHWEQAQSQACHYTIEIVILTTMLVCTSSRKLIEKHKLT